MLLFLTWYTGYQMTFAGTWPTPSWGKLNSFILAWAYKRGYLVGLCPAKEHTPKGVYSFEVFPVSSKVKNSDKHILGKHWLTIQKRDVAERKNTKLQEFIKSLIFHWRISKCNMLANFWKLSTLSSYTKHQFKNATFITQIFLQFPQYPLLWWTYWQSTQAISKVILAEVSLWLGYQYKNKDMRI